MVQKSGTDEFPDDVTTVLEALPSASTTAPPSVHGASVHVHSDQDMKVEEVKNEELDNKKGTSPLLIDQTNFLPVRQVIAVFLGLSVALACAFLEQTIVATALPRISSDLRAGRESSWVATAYLLTSLAFTPLYGRWSDVFGRKAVLLTSLGIFFIFSLACALAHTMIQLIVFRALQGIGGGAIITMVLIIVADVVPLKDRGKYQGINEIVIAMSNGLGPVLGGIFAEYTTWRWAFWINLPLAGFAILVGIFLIPLKSARGDMKAKLLVIDYAGSFLTITSSVLLLLALNWGGVTYPWVSAPVLVPLFLGVLFMALFLIWEAKFAKLPIVPVHIFKNKTVVGVYIATVMNGMTFFAILYYVPQFLQLVQGKSPVSASLLTLSFLAPIAFFVLLAGQITARTGHYRYLIIVGYCIWSVAQGLQSTINEHSSTGKIVGFLLMAGVSSGLTFQTSLIAAQAAVPRHEMAVVTGVRNFVRLFGSTISLAICASLVNNTLRSVIAPLGLSDGEITALVDEPTIINDPAKFTLGAESRALVIAGYTKGFHNVFYLTAACTSVAFLASVLMIEQLDLNRADDKELKERGKEEFRKRMEKRNNKDLEKGRLDEEIIKKKEEQ